eukprot:1148820-Pelagomonas_calceolata.AAC.6
MAGGGLVGPGQPSLLLCIPLWGPNLAPQVLATILFQLPHDQRLFQATLPTEAHAIVPVKPTDTPKKLAARVLVQERKGKGLPSCAYEGSLTKASKDVPAT